MTATYRVTPRLQAGLEYNPAASEVGFIGNYTLTPETAKWPMISLGTSSDRIGTPKGPHAYYATFAKGIPALKIAPYISVNYSEHDRQLNFPFGANIQLTKELSLMPMHDGRKSHLLLTYSQEKYNVSLMWVWFKHPGISLSFGF